MYIVIAFFLGILNVISKSINYKATQHLGNYNGALVNYVVASILALVIVIFNHDLNMTQLVSAPTYLYLAGVFGAIAFFFNVTSLAKMNLFMSTIVILMGQLVGSIVLDLCLGMSITPMRIFGVIIMFIGVIIDKKLMD